MESLYKGKNGKSHFKQLSVTQDMTKNDRSEMQKKAEGGKEKKRENTGEYIWRVRGATGSLKVVRLRKRQ